MLGVHNSRAPNDDLPVSDEAGWLRFRSSAAK